MSNDGRTVGTLQTRVSKTLAIVVADFSLLCSVALAHFIVWKILRRRFKENSVRRKEFKLLRGDDSLAQEEPNKVRGFDWRANAIVNSSGGSPPEH